MSIFRLFSNIRLKLRRRAAIDRACTRAEPSVIADFLANYPGEHEFIASYAVRVCKTGGVWYGLMLALGLVEATSPSGIVVLRQLLDHRISSVYPVPWRRLNDSQMRSITDY